MRRLAASLVIIFAMSWVPASGAADAVDHVSRAVSLATAGAIRVDATEADLTIAGVERPNVQIDVERRAPTRDDLGRFPVEINASTDGLHVSVRQQDDGRDPRLKSTITIAAPVSARFSSVRVFEGRVRISDVRSAADVSIRRGAIDAARVGGRIRLDSELGSIDVRDAELTPDGMLRLRVFNGPVHVRLGHRPSNARILAVTFNGGITSDIPLTMKDQFGPRFGETTIGSGEPVLSMDVVKGDINLTVGR